MSHPHQEDGSFFSDEKIQSEIKGMLYFETAVEPNLLGIQVCERDGILDHARNLLTI